MEPALMREDTPLTVTSTWPDLRMASSSPESTMSTAVDWPGLRVVRWLSSVLKVRVGELTTLTCEPLGVGVDGRLLQSMTVEASLPGTACSMAGRSEERRGGAAG